jgi:hypothetical protein
VPRNDHEVFDYLLADTETEYLDYVAFAIYIHDKHNWLDHFTRQNGRLPSDAEIETWIANLTDLDFRRFIDSAAELFDDAAQKYLADELATEQDKAFHTKCLPN